MNHKPSCSTNIHCAVYHNDGICTHRRECDCGFEGHSQKPVEGVQNCKVELDLGNGWYGSCRLIKGHLGYHSAYTGHVDTSKDFTKLQNMGAVQKEPPNVEAVQKGLREKIDALRPDIWVHNSQLSDKKNAYLRGEINGINDTLDAVLKILE